MEKQPPETVLLCQDSFSIAGQLGRLDLVSLLLAVLSIAVAISGVIVYLNIRHRAKKQASKIAREVAEKVSEKIANEYMQKELPRMYEAYATMVRESSGEGANEIAASIASGENGERK